jgi:predicted O-methyltransferase YrrM
MQTVDHSELSLMLFKVNGSTYLNTPETALLIGLVQSVYPKVMIEIGCQLGCTAIAILKHVPSLESYIGIDVPFHHQTTLPGQQSEVPASPGLYALDPRFHLLIRETGSQELEPDDLEPCDVVFIDGDHSENAVLRDSLLAQALVRPGGIIVWHDYNNQTVEVTSALNQLSDAGWPITHITDTWLAFCRIEGGNHADQTR